MFFRGSRYQNVGEAQLTDGRGRTVRYKKARFIAESRADFLHTVRQNERLDQIAHERYGDPERFWRICDLNRALWPDELVAEPGRQILIPPSEG